MSRLEAALALLDSQTADELEFIRHNRVSGKESLMLARILKRIGWLQEKPRRDLHASGEQAALLWLLSEFVRNYALDIGILDFEAEPQESIVPRHMRLRASSVAVRPRNEHPKRGR